MTPLEQLSTEITTSQSALGKQRDGAKPIIADAKKAHGELLGRINAELPKASAAEIEAGVKKVDQEITDAQYVVSTLGSQIGQAEQALAEAQNRLKAAEVASEAARTQLRQLSKPAQAAQERVIKLKADAQAAVEAGQTRKAYYLTLELGKALDMLEQLLDPQKAAALSKEVNDSRAAHIAVQQEVDEKTTALNKLKEELPNKQRELKNKEQQREEQIKPLLTAAPAAAGGLQREVAAKPNAQLPDEAT